eukprot:TRINITY_DN14734_c0_g1_i1.p1 TRINITY_DN14734_c0_g1~~TRINITY_DN14734_c0_g1_i1.p1  ORF type:complete len:247 (-),score=46.52 TRINITY_DN14734_c0_g1_i1:174-914(-)
MAKKNARMILKWKPYTRMNTTNTNTIMITKKKKHTHKHTHTHEINSDGDEEADSDLDETDDGDDANEAPDLHSEAHTFNVDADVIVIQKHHHHGRKIPYMLFAVLALESFISGSALGVQQTFIKVLVTFIAITTHIWAEAFTLSTAILKSKVSTARTLQVMVGFSMITPVAIIFGMLLATVLTGTVITFVSSFLVSFAAGTFLFVACMEIMAEEFAIPSQRKTKMALVLAGFGFMALLAFIFDDVL